MVGLGKITMPMSGHMIRLENAMISTLQMGRQDMGLFMVITIVCSASRVIMENLHILMIFLGWAFVPGLVNGQEPEIDLQTMSERRITRISGQYYNTQLAQRWMTELTENGTWSDVDYTTGCEARRANWPAQDHFHRILNMASVWSVDKNPALLSACLSALDHWFSNDFQSDDCINAGGRLGCPCGTLGYWNTNWYCQMILIPGLVGSTCLLLAPALAPSQLSACITQTNRSWVRIDGDPNGAQGPQTGANMLDVASIATSLSLFTQNHSLLLESMDRMWTECDINVGPPTVDGIKVDGAFMQHAGQIYQGNYGKVFLKQMLGAFQETKGTSLSPPPPHVQNAFTTMFVASEWLMYRKADLLSWSYSVIGRMVSHKWSDWNGIDLSLPSVLDATQDWDGATVFQEVVARLMDNDNPWELIGSRYFHTADLLINRGIGYTTSLKMYSSRTVNSECNNDQNPFGYHLSDGTIYTQLSGQEYTDVYGAWDWDLVPGTSSLYKSFPLSCSQVMIRGLHDMVGAVTLDSAAVAVMTHTDPKTRSHSFMKSFFFFPDGSYAVQFPELWWNTSSTGGPFRTTLDQRQAMGTVYLDGFALPNGSIQELDGSNVWHDRVGYAFSARVGLGVGVVQRVADWEAIGISVGNETQNHFVAYVNHPEQGENKGVGYVARVNVDQAEFQSSPQGSVTLLTPALNVTASFYNQEPDMILGLVFLSASNYTTGLTEIPWVSTDAPLLILFQRIGVENWSLGVADSTQSLVTVNVAAYIQGVLVERRVELPTGPYAGSSVFISLQD